MCKKAALRRGHVAETANAQAGAVALLDSHNVGAPAAEAAQAVLEQHIAERHGE